MIKQVLLALLVFKSCFGASCEEDSPVPSLKKVAHSEVISDGFDMMEKDILIAKLREALKEKEEILMKLDKIKRKYNKGVGMFRELEEKYKKLGEDNLGLIDKIRQLQKK